MSLNLQQDEHIEFWNKAHIDLVQIEKYCFAPGKKGISTVCRTSAFLYLSRGNAMIALHNRLYSVADSQLFHIAPDSPIEVIAGAEGAELILLMYKAQNIPDVIKSEAAMYDDEHKNVPFHTSYRFTPQYPVQLYELLKQLHELWHKHDALAHFQAKAHFYDWILCLVQQYHSQLPATKMANPVELVTQAMEYMLKYYNKSLTLESLASAMGRSPGHLSNCFKQVLNRGPIDCLIRLRMEKGKSLLLDTNLPLRSIAAEIGYQDVYYFSNAFKKFVGMSPSHYRNMGKKQENITLTTGRNQIVEENLSCYIDNNYYYQYIDGGSKVMFKSVKAIPVALLLAFGLMLGACGGGNAAKPANVTGQTATTNTNNSSSTNANSGSNIATNTNAVVSESEAASSTRIVSTANGEVEVPANPQRVVTDFYLGHLLALGVKPVGTNGIFMKNPYLEGQLDGIADISDNLELILSLTPDLIITGNLEEVERFSKIAPTVYLNNIADMRSLLEQLGEVLNKQEEAEQWLAAYDVELQKAKARISPIIKEGETVTVFDGGIIKDLSLYGNAYTGRTIHGELGLPLHPNVERDIDPKVGWLTISSEVVSEYASPYIFMAVNLENETFDYGSDPLWGTLDAVKNNTLYEIDGYRFYFSDPISTLGQIYDIADMIEERAAANAE